ncbi:MAG: hypothetical protein ABIR24_01485 [Verrucomicrobiota bacterium]
MRKSFLWSAIFLVGLNTVGFAQIDPEKRRLFQLGYNQPIEGRGPISGYGFYYHNKPEFLRTNITLRLAIAPIYIDTELGFAHALGEHTDFAIGAAGGGFADSYSEVRQGRLFEDESFTGHSGEISASIYHLFNPERLIPLSGILRMSAHHSIYKEDSDTSDAFELPEDRTSLNVRAGFRWGGKEPVMRPDLGMELSAWYEGQFRTEYGNYGFNGDRTVRPSSHLFWGRALLIYTLPELKHNFSISLTAGTSLASDRFSSYRLGGVLPLIAEFPLSLPGYYFQEISARRFALLSGQYSLPLDAAKQWNVTASGTIATVDYVSGLEQPGSTHSGAGLGVGYRSKKNTWEIIVGYSYGFQAIRNHGRGAQNIGLIFQYDLEARHKGPYFDIESPYKSRGLFRLLGE